METAKYFEMWVEIRALFDEIIKKYDSIWVERERKINTRFLILFIFRLVIPKDERGYGNTLIEIFNNFLNYGIDNVPTTIAPSSICEARMKLNPIIFKELNNGILEIWNRYQQKPALWNGLRLYGVDGSKLTLPSELVKVGYKKPGDHAHYPQGLLSGVYDLLTGIPQDFDFVGHNNERTCALEHLKHIQKDSVNVYDRGYFSFELLHDHMEQQRHAIFRLQSKTRIQVIDDFWESDDTERFVLMPPPQRIVRDVKMGHSKIKLRPIEIRLIKYTINEKKYVLLTTLLDKEKYPEDIFKGAYNTRWEHEEMLKVSKVITGVKDFHSKNESGVKQELFAHFVIITLLKIIQSQSHCEVEKEIKNKEIPKRRIMPRIKQESKLKAAPKTTKEKGVLEKIKINQKSAFLLVGWALEKLFYWNPFKFIEESVSFMVNSAKKLYQKVRLDRNYPRVSKTAPSKWYKRKFIKKMEICNAIP